MKRTQIVVKSMVFFCLLILALVSCNDSKSNKSKEEGEKVTTEKEAMNGAAASPKSYCFRNEYPHEGSSDKDVLELQIDLNGDAVKGTYNWLPAFKDQRKGVFRGELKNNVVKGEYSFQQEGTSETVRIEITLHEDKAVVKGGEPELGLNETIEKVECEN